MPWWVWLLLALFMLAMIVMGGIYVFVHGMRALRVIGDTGARVSRPIEAMSRVAIEPEPAEPPLFTQPLTVAAERYERAHVKVIERRNTIRERHAQAWASWLHFND